MGAPINVKEFKRVLRMATWYRSFVSDNCRTAEAVGPKKETFEADQGIALDILQYRLTELLTCPNFA